MRADSLRSLRAQSLQWNRKLPSTLLLDHPVSCSTVQGTATRRTLASSHRKSVRLSLSLVIVFPPSFGSLLAGKIFATGEIFAISSSLRRLSRPRRHLGRDELRRLAACHARDEWNADSGSRLKCHQRSDMNGVQGPRGQGSLNNFFSSA
jgi:hypothetical protein